MSAISRRRTADRARERGGANGDPPTGVAFEAAPTGMALISARQGELGRFLRVNAAACRLSGYREEELLATGLEPLTSPDDRERDLSSLRRLLSGETDRCRIEKRVIRPDGSLMWVQVDRSLVRDERGEPQYIVAQIQDVSASRRRIQRLECEHVVARLLTQSVTAQGAVSALLPALGEVLDCQVAFAWVADEGAGRLRCDAAWQSGAAGAATAALSRQVKLAPGDGLPGRVWEAGAADFSADVPGDPSSSRASAAAADGLRVGIGFPLVVGTERLGVLEFIGVGPIEADRELLAVLDEVGAQVTAFITARRRVEEIPGSATELLLVEDNPFIATLVGEMLSGVEPRLALLHSPSLADARKRLLASTPACVLLDLMLPDANGLQGLLELRKLAPEVPIVVLTAQEDQDLAVRAVQEGAQDYLIKRKVDMDALARSVRYAIERKRAERRLFEDTLYDRLTGLPNGLLLSDRLRVALARTEHSSGQVALLRADLNRFRLVNDSLGHAAGDQVIVETAERIRAHVAEEVTVAALGGDHFAVLAENIADPRAAVELAERLLAAVSAPFRLGEEETQLDASVGIALANGDRPDAEALLHDADTALSRAKELGAGYEIFEEGVRTRMLERLQLENQLRAALDSGELRLHYQPIISLDDGETVSLEALLRWQHPERGLLSPGEFLPVAEQSGLIVPMGRWVLGEACRQLARWKRRTRGDGPRINVNLSPIQLRDPQLVQDVRTAIEAARLIPSDVCLEITESALMDDTDGSLETLRALKEEGVALALDDFGTGYSSLGYLRRFPIDELKIDRSLVTGLGADARLAAIASAIVTMGRELGMPVIAEGAESREDASRLRALGCQLAQGYHFARPLPQDEAEAFLTRRAAGDEGDGPA